MVKSQARSSLLPAYLICGEDALKRAAVLKRLKRKVAESGDISLNFDEFSCESASGPDIVSACNTLPFLSDKRLVVAVNVEKLKKHDSEILISYLESPNASTVLALLAGKLSKSSRLYKAVVSISKDAFIDCAIQKRSELIPFVSSLAAAHGMRLPTAAAKKLIEFVGEDTLRLDNELKKLSLAHNASGPVTELEIDTIIAHTSEIKPWQFVDAMSSRDLPKCLVYLKRMPSVSPYALTSMCTTRIRELICANVLLSRNEENLLSRALKQPEWRLKNHFIYAQKFSDSELRSAIVNLRETERLMKSGMDPHTAFLDWLIGFVSLEHSTKKRS